MMARNLYFLRSGTNTVDEEKQEECWTDSDKKIDNGGVELVCFYNTILTFCQIFAYKMFLL